MAVNKKKVANKEKDKEVIKCCKCGLEKAPINFYVSYSPFHAAINKTPYCKDCVKSSVNPHDELSVKQMLRLLDKPFLNDLYYETAKKEAENANRDWFSTYIKNLGMAHFKDMTFADSDESDDDRKEKRKSSDEFWGGGYSKSDIEFLEDFYREYEYTFATDNPVQVNIYKSIAIANLQARKALENGKQKDYRDLMKLSSDLHKDAHINPAQVTGANDDKGVSTYGLWIKMIEQEEPCEHFADKPLYEDFDSFGTYIKKNLFRPMMNLFGVTRNFDYDMEDEQVNEEVEEILEEREEGVQ